LKLWRKYEEFVDAGILEPMLNDIYATGSQVKFKAPGSGGNVSQHRASASFGASGRDTPEPMTTPKKGSAFGGVGFRSPMHR
jgi:PAB-dependent poly(A)-specific ribonuclease subunit 2